jgi:adenylylsulfate kinase-like enzyme
VLCSFISPFRAERTMVRELVPDGEFIEVFVDTPLEECIRRDPKGLYARAKAGLIKNFTGIDSPYEAPENPDLRLDTLQESLAQSAARVVALLQERQILGWGGAGRGDTQTWI